MTERCDTEGAVMHSEMLPFVKRPGDSGAADSPDQVSSFTFVDLFAGIGGFHLAMENLGGRCVMACEIDEDCRYVYTKRWPTVEFRSDIRRDVVDRIRSGDERAVPRHDVL